LKQPEIKDTIQTWNKKMRIIIDFSSKAMEAKRPTSNIFLVLKEKYKNLVFYRQGKYPLKKNAK
jgi:hypothetical protein